MYDFLGSIKTVDKIRSETPERALAMSQAARELGHLSVTQLPDTGDGLKVRIAGIIDTERLLGPFYDRTNAIVNERRAAAEKVAGNDAQIETLPAQDAIEETAA